MTERMHKGQVVGRCRYCGKAVVYRGTGPIPLTCHRKICKRQRSREQTAAHRSRKKVLDPSHQAT